MTRRGAIAALLGGPAVWKELVRPHESTRHSIFQNAPKPREAAIIRHSLDLWEVRYLEERWKGQTFTSLGEAQAFQARYLLADTA